MTHIRKLDTFCRGQLPYVSIDPLHLDTDIPLLWEALGGNDGTINERLKWYGLAPLLDGGPEDFCYPNCYSGSKSKEIAPGVSTSCAR
jgi:hypothetical protein